ncbi:hypothetical protein D3C85_1828260 [compost metagenome]
MINLANSSPVAPYGALNRQDSVEEFFFRLFSFEHFIDDFAVTEKYDALAIARSIRIVCDHQHGRSEG